MNTVSLDWRVPEVEQAAGWIEDALNAALQYEGVDFPCELEALVVSPDEIREMNKTYRDIDRTTDVLSFPLYTSKEEMQADRLEGEPAELGDMVLCMDKAKRQAEEYGHSLRREVSFLTVHSVLHLLGYDHETGEREETEMFRRQNEIMDKLKITRED